MNEHKALSIEAEHLRQECKLLADVLRDAYEVIKTVEGENSDEEERLWDLRMTIEAALSGYDQERIADAALNTEVRL